eukprot:Nitzschia sp. Nitz4//scaffold109_size72162//61021//62130//NITZ4_005856-RA/size72162-processed-gene-0.22-mRNA-1//1//CDS//3329532793//2064//frame0
MENHDLFVLDAHKRLQHVDSDDLEPDFERNSVLPDEEDDIIGSLRGVRTQGWGSSVLFSPNSRGKPSIRFYPGSDSSSELEPDSKSSRTTEGNSTMGNTQHSTMTARSMPSLHSYQSSVGSDTMSFFDIDSSMRDSFYEAPADAPASNTNTGVFNARGGFALGDLCFISEQCAGLKLNELAPSLAIENNETKQRQRWRPTDETRLGNESGSSLEAVSRRRSLPENGNDDGQADCAPRMISRRMSGELPQSEEERLECDESPSSVCRPLKKDPSGIPKLGKQSIRCDIAPVAAKRRVSETEPFLLAPLAEELEEMMSSIRSPVTSSGKKATRSDSTPMAAVRRRSSAAGDKAPMPTLEEDSEHDTQHSRT